MMKWLALWRLFVLGAVPADTDWLDLARPVIEKRIQK